MGRDQLIRILALALGICLILSGCQSANPTNVVPDSTKPITEQISQGMTLEDAVSLLGPPDEDLLSSLHPYYLEWDLEDGSKLRICFSGEEFGTFYQALKDGTYRLPKEMTPGEDDPVHVDMFNQYYHPYGLGKMAFIWTGESSRPLTENELKTILEWDNSTVATYACIIANGEETVLFSST